MFLKTAELICDLRLRSERVSILCMCRKQKNNTHAPRKNEPCTEHINVQDKQKKHMRRKQRAMHKPYQCPR